MPTFEIIARAVLLKNNRALLCKHRGKNSGYRFWGHTFLPGGHVEFGEKVEHALARELKEELGIAVKKTRFIGAVPNVYIYQNVRHHELNLVFWVEPRSFASIQSRESHIDFVWRDLKSFGSEPFLPVKLKKAVTQWVKSRKTFWVE